MINHVTGWFKVMEYSDKHAISIANLVETTWLTRYPWPTEITHDRGSGFISYDLIKYLIEIEYGILFNSSHQVIQLPILYWNGFTWF